MTEKERFEKWFNSLDWYAEGIPRGVFYGTALQAWKAARRWIPVDEELPESNVDVLLTDNYDIMIGYYNAEKKRWGTTASGYDADNYDGGCTIRLDSGDIKKWQPLPPPEEERE